MKESSSLLQPDLPPWDSSRITRQGGVMEEKFEEITGFKVPEDKSVLVRDFVIDKGIEFGEIKDKFAEQ